MDTRPDNPDFAGWSETIKTIGPRLAEMTERSIRDTIQTDAARRNGICRALGELSHTGHWIRFGTTGQQAMAPIYMRLIPRDAEKNGQLVIELDREKIPGQVAWIARLESGADMKDRLEAPDTLDDETRRALGQLADACARLRAGDRQTQTEWWNASARFADPEEAAEAVDVMLRSIRCGEAWLPGRRGNDLQALARALGALGSRLDLTYREDGNLQTAAITTPTTPRGSLREGGVRHVRVATNQTEPTGASVSLTPAATRRADDLYHRLELNEAAETVMAAIECRLTKWSPWARARRVLTAIHNDPQAQSWESVKQIRSGPPIDHNARPWAEGRTAVERLAGTAEPQRQ